MKESVFKTAKWICAKKILNKKTDYFEPALQLRKVFDFHKTKVVCRICGLGIYTLYINGKKVGDDVLSPAFTAYDQRVLYVEYRNELEEYLREGKNTIAVKLGNGFYNQTTNDVWGFSQASWRDAPKLLFEIVTSTGEVVCQSDESWKITENGATIHNAIRTGEYYDARKEDSWKEIEYDDSMWMNAQIANPTGGKICKSNIPPIRECETLKAVDFWKSEKGWIFDFGKNSAGYVKISLKGREGQTITLRYAEHLRGREIFKENKLLCGEIEFAADKYTCKGEGIEEWKPEFVYHGFQYVEIIGLEEEPTSSSLTAYFVHTDLKQKGKFSSDHELLQWIYESGVRSFLSNVHGFIEDCPHREKNGWTDDAAISCDHSVYLFEMQALYKKWLTDMKDTQRPNGALPGIVPTAGWGYNWGNGPTSDCAMFFLPYALYKETGDKSCLFTVYEAAKKYLRYAEYYRKGGLVCFGLHDWAMIDAERSASARMSNELSDSCHYYKMQCIIAETARLKGDIQYSEQMRLSAEETRLAIAEKYICGESVDNNEQGALASVLYYEIVRGEQANGIARRLVERIKEDKYVFKVGIFGMKALLNALSSYGYTDEVFKMIDRYEYPSYGDWKKQGATTLWEYWNGCGSRNHHMYTDVVHWIIRNIAGLQNKGIAYNKCVLKPFFYSEECICSTETKTPKGKIAFSWKKRKNEFCADILIPEGCEAILVLPNKEPIVLKESKKGYLVKLS